jgi:hypothetical protein
MFINFHTHRFVVIIIITIITIIIIRHQLDLDRPVSTSYNSLFEGFPSRFRPFCP